MRQTTTREKSTRKRGYNRARLASAALVLGLTLSMSVSASASIGFNGGSAKTSPHLDHTVHHTNAGKLVREDNPGDAPWDNLTSSYYNGTIYIKVGETVTVHLLQRGVAFFGEEGLSMPQWYGYNGRDYQATVGIRSDLDGLSNKEAVATLKVYKAQNDGGSDLNTAYCMEMFLTGKKPGTEYFYYADGGGALEGGYYKVVVTGGEGRG